VKKEEKKYLEGICTLGECVAIMSDISPPLDVPITPT